MDYLLSFLEGILTFISPCFLPMLPIYLAYFAAGNSGGTHSYKGVSNTLAFIAGFTTVFVGLGAFAATIGGFLIQYQTTFNVVTGFVVILFGLHYLGLFSLILPSFGISQKEVKITGPFSSFLFGLVFSVSWTPCVGAFLGSALMLASQSASANKGILMLLFFSAGLAIPFFISALLIDKLSGTFTFIKKHYGIITKLSGLFLIVVGLFMATGTLGRLLAQLSF